MLRATILASAISCCIVSPAMAQSETSWTGPYAGVSVGIAGDSMDYPFRADYTPSSDSMVEAAAVTSANSLTGKASLTSSGVMGGVVAGYDMQIGSGIVVGLVTDFSLSSVKGAVNLGADADFTALTGTASGTVQSRLQHLGTVRARVGVPVANGRFMPYVTGGFAYGRVKSSASLDFSGSTDLTESTTSASGALGVSKKTNHTGWVAGAGAEYAVSDHVHFGIEYLHAELKTKTLIGGQFALDSLPLVGSSLGSGTVDAALGVKPKVNIVRASMTYRF